MKIAVVYATVGRAETMATALDFIREQTRRPDQIVISVAAASDAPPPATDLPVRVVSGPKGSSPQRNTGVEAVRGAADIVVFFDDDFAPAPTYLATLEKIFTENPDIAGVTGDVIADGIKGPGYTFDQAREFMKGYQPPAWPGAETKPSPAMYGCNMAVRLSMAAGIAFDEQLPLYAWQEDVDYTALLARRGRTIWTNAVGGVHLGIKRARTAGLMMGYSQVANPIYLCSKGTMRFGHAYTLIARNIVMNVLRSARPEPWFDRRGRTAGNMRALGDLVLGRLHPGNILKFANLPPEKQ